MTAILLSALFAGLVAIGVTVAIERWGGVVGGLVGTLPSTIVPAAFGIANAAPSAAAFGDAMYATPAGMLLNVGFLYLWRVLPPRIQLASPRARLGLVAAIALCAWGVAATLLVLGMHRLRTAGIPMAWVGWSTTGAMLVAGILACLQRRPAPKGARSVGMGTLLARGVLAASAIGASVALAAAGGDLAAGVAAVFPAIFLTTMVSLWLSQGEAVPGGAVGPMMLGSVAVATFSLLAVPAMGAMGPAGAVPAWLGAALCITLPATLWLRR